MRVSFPITTVSQPSSFIAKPVACPIFRQASGVTTLSTGPLIPSVPNFKLIEMNYNSSAAPLIEVFFLDLPFGVSSDHPLGSLGVAPAIISSI